MTLVQINERQTQNSYTLVNFFRLRSARYTFISRSTFCWMNRTDGSKQKVKTTNAAYLFALRLARTLTSPWVLAKFLSEITATCKSKHGEKRRCRIRRRLVDRSPFYLVLTLFHTFAVRTLPLLLLLLRRVYWVLGSCACSCGFVCARECAVLIYLCMSAPIIWTPIDVSVRHNLCDVTSRMISLYIVLGCAPIYKYNKALLFFSSAVCVSHCLSVSCICANGRLARMWHNTVVHTNMRTNTHVHGTDVHVWVQRCRLLTRHVCLRAQNMP